MARLVTAEAHILTLSAPSRHRAAGDRSDHLPRVWIAAARIRHWATPPYIVAVHGHVARVHHVVARIPAADPGITHHPTPS